MDRIRKIELGYLSILAVFLIVIIFLLLVLADAKEECEAYYEKKVNDYIGGMNNVTENYLFDTEKSSPQMYQFPEVADIGNG